VWALQAFGIRCVIGHQLAEFFIENCLKNGVLPIELDMPMHQQLMQDVIFADGYSAVQVDLRNCQIRGLRGGVMAFEIDSQQRRMLLEGLDEIDMTLKHMVDIERWESRNQVL
jgi:3-isopropylmalate/(R)-2-methylmalate dehydratase small subunit